ncbi:MAG TPA: zinc ribbon domain-containing protein [Methylomirabilota bacterium]|nr:zinc ribbon domain-containing protein [Methylomirabilota bacterium]
MAESTSPCPHCGAQNDSLAAFCGACGKALPDSRASGPRLVTAELPDSNAARQLVGEELKAHVKKAKGALLAVAIIQTIFALIFFPVARSNPEIASFVPFVVLAIAAIYWALFVWAGHNPLPAAIVGLVLYVTIHLLDAIADPSQLARGILIKILIVVALSRAINAGIKYRRLLPQLKQA